MAEIKSIKGYEHKLKPETAVLVVTSKDYTHIIEIPDFAEAEKKGEKIDIEKIVADRETILKANQKLIDAKVAKHAAGKKEIDYSKLVATVGDAGGKA